MMPNRSRFWTLLLLGLAIVTLVVLAAGLSDLQLQPGRPLPRGMEAEDLLGIGLGELPRNPFGEVLILALFFLAQLLLPIAIVYVIISPEARKNVLRMLGILIWLPALYLILRARAELLEIEVTQHPEVSPADQAFTEVAFTATPPEWLINVTTIGLAVLAAAALVGMIWSIRHRRRRPPMGELVREAEEAIEALKEGADYEDTILRCYFEMSRVLNEEQGLVREEAMTPREFERTLGGAGVPGEPVRRLTRLFEDVRYGDKLPGTGKEDEAITCLTFIVEACRGGS